MGPCVDKKFSFGTGELFSKSCLSCANAVSEQLKLQSWLKEKKQKQKPANTCVLCQVLQLTCKQASLEVPPNLLSPCHGLLLDHTA